MLPSTSALACKRHGSKTRACLSDRILLGYMAAWTSYVDVEVGYAHQVCQGHRRYGTLIWEFDYNFTN